MSVRNTFPQQRPTLNLDFANSKTLDPRITFSRPQTGNGVTYVGEDGLIKYASADEPRFDHDPETGECLGLLVEESRVNYEKYTEDPTQWTIVNMIPTGNSITLPTGEVSTTIEYRGETTDANNKLIRPLPTNSGVVAGETWCFSIFLKAGTEDTTRLQFQNNTGGDSVGRTFNMETGEWAENLYVSGSNTGDSGYEYYGNGWYRVWLVNTYSADAGAQQTFMRLNANSNAVPLTTSFSAWGAQLEKASFPSSYIPNDTESQKTRNSDSVSMTGDNFSDWYNPSEGSIYCSVYNVGVTTTTSRFFYAIEDASAPSSDFMRQWIWSGNTSLLLNSFYTSNTTGQGSVISAEFSVSLEDVNKKISVGYAQSDFARSYNGSLTTDTSGNLPTGIDRLRIGTNLSGHISKLTYYPTRLSNDQLQNLTK